MVNSYEHKLIDEGVKKRESGRPRPKVEFYLAARTWLQLMHVVTHSGVRTPMKSELVIMSTFKAGAFIVLAPKWPPRENATSSSGTGSGSLSTSDWNL